MDHLGQEFGFDENDPEIVGAIIHMGITYCTLGGKQGHTKTLRSQYNRLAREIGSLRKTLDKGERLGLPRLMHFAALQLKNESPFNADLPDLSENDRKDGEDIHFRELLCLLDVLSSCLKENVRRRPVKQGGRDHQALDALAFKAAELFAWKAIGRPFYVDRYRQTKETKTFAFVKALVMPLENTVTDDEIVGALRIARGRIKRPKI